jgi:hypothetical protein
MVLYHDQFLPAPKAIIDELEEAAKKAIWGRLSAKVSHTRLTTAVDHGGFGLHNLGMQLRLARAKWIYRLTDGAAWTNGSFRNIRLRLNLPTVFRDYIVRSDISSAQPGRAFKWNWSALLCHPPNLKMGTSIAHARICLPPRWNEYLEAWNDATVFVLNGYTHWNNWLVHVLKRTPALRVPLPRHGFLGPHGEPMTAGDFTHAIAPYHKVVHPVIIPASWQSIFGIREKR